MSYDKNGNITTLQRTGNVDGFDQVIDDLSYTYIGNQLQKVSEAPIANAQFGFKDGTNTDNDYSYDVFGNMTKDQNKGITDIKYNHLNLPIKITFVNGNFITYLYDAMGVKVNKYVQGTSGSTSTASSTDYLTGFQYNNQILQFFPHAEGYVHVLKGGSDISSFMFDYVYQYKDHLGNIRVSYVADKSNDTYNSDQSIPLKITTENHYYPFGLQHTYNFSKYEPMLEIKNGIATKRIMQVPNSGYQYKYNGKEWQDELNLNLYDYHARNYDPAIGRWMNIDPLAENSRRWNPYNYAYNNPIYFIDPDGMQSQEFNGSSAVNLSSGGFSDDVDTMVDMGYGRVVSSRHLNGAVNFSGGDLRITGGDKPKKKTFTDAGHGIDGTNNPCVDPGAVDGNHYEKDYALLIEEQVNYWLNIWEVDNSRTRTEDITINENSLNYRWKLANKHGAIVFVSFHLNSGNGDEVFGVYQQGKSNENGSKELACYIFSNLTLMNVSNNNTRAVNTFTRFNTVGILNNFQGNAGILLELGGIGSEINRNNILNNANEIGKQIATGIYQFLYNGNLPTTPAMRGRNK